MDQFMKKTIEKDFKRFFNNVGKRKEYVGDLVVIKARKLKGCNLDINGPLPKFNITPDPEYGIIKTRFRTLHDGDYRIPLISNRDFDTLFIMRINRGKCIIEDVYAIPKKELDGKRVITIDCGQTYQKFKIDEKPYNEIYCIMRTGKYSITEDDSIIIT